MNALDSRTVKTRAKIEAAMQQLCNDRVDFDTLTAPQVARAAGIARQTFYRHYQTPQEVVVKLIQRHLQEFLDHFQLQNLTATSMTAQLLAAWQGRTGVFELIEWAHTQSDFIQAVAKFNQQIAQRNHRDAQLDLPEICNVYGAAIYMFLRDFVLQKKWTQAEGAALLMHLTNNMDKLF